MTSTGGTTGGGGATSSGGGGATSSGGGGAGGCATGSDNVYDNTTAEDLALGCKAIAPAPGEDGTFAITVFPSFGQAFTLDGFTFGARESGTTMVTDPWTASVTVVPAGGDPTAVDPSAGAKPYPLLLVDSFPSDQTTTNVYSITLDSPIDVGACESVVVALRNSEGPPYTGLEMCGHFSKHPKNNLWWNLDGTMDVMAELSENFDRNWLVTLTPAP